jgi:hypothetical protein
MIKKDSYSILSIFMMVTSILLLLLFFYQIYITKKISSELNQIKEVREYYIQFLNAVTLHLKKKILNQ